MAHFNHFDFLAPIYDRFIKPKDPVKLRALLDIPDSSNLLDVGGGTGRISFMLRDSVKRIVIADSSIGMLTQAMNKNCFLIVCLNSEGLPFKAGSFERVIMVDALHHVYDYKATANELWRVVKPGGRIVIEEPNIHKMPVKITAIVEKLTLMRSHFVSPLEISNSFSYPNANTFIEREGFTAWVVVDKESG
jgi:ubiquinone/menaquinone biosynthesis C-methylase UbiE